MTPKPDLLKLHKQYTAFCDNDSTAGAILTCAHVLVDSSLTLSHDFVNVCTAINEVLDGVFIDPNSREEAQ